MVHYQDEWLRLKTRLYDGNVLRVSLFDRVKMRKGFYKRGAISGKQKWRAGSSQDMHRLRIAVTARPDAYTVKAVSHTGAIPNSRLVFENAEVAGGQLQVSAATTQEFDAWDVLNALRFAYDHVQPRQTA
jgi:nucleoid-associated protein YgaU